MDLEQFKERLGHLRGLAPRGRSLAAFLFALLIVSTAAGSGWLGPDAQRVHDRTAPVGEAEAFPCGGACIVGVGLAAGFASGYVANEYFSGDSTNDVFAETDATETHIEVSTHVDTVASSQKTLDVVMTNQVEDGSRTVAWSKGKAAAVKAMNNGANESETKAAAKEAVEDYYTTMEMNLVNSRNDSINKAAYLDEVYKSQGSLSGSFIFARQGGLDAGYSDMGTSEFTLVNGTVVTVATPVGTDTDTIKMDWTPGSRTANYTGPTTDFGAATLHANYEANVTPSRPDGLVVNGTRSAALFSEIANANSQMKSNLDLWVGNYHSSYTAGDINETDLLDPSTLAQEFATDYEDTGYYAYAAGDLAVQGTNGTFNESFTIVLNDSTVLNGTLFTDWEPSATGGSFETGTTYQIDNATAPVYFATNDGLRLIQQDFEITEMTNVQTGETVNSTQLQDYNRQTADTSLTADQLAQLLELRQELDEKQAQAGGGGGLLGSLGLDGMSTGVILALGAVVALFLLKPE
jgi:hypothetical protein